MRLRLVIYAVASLALLAFHAPVQALASLFSTHRELYSRRRAVLENE